MCLFVRSAGVSAYPAGVLALCLLALAGVGQVVVAASLAPSPRLMGSLVLAAMGSALPLAVALAALAGVAGGMQRLRASGALLALASLGLPSRALAGCASAWALPFALVWGLSAHLVEPFSRALLRDTRASVAAAIAPSEAKTVHVGGWYFAVDGGRLRFTDGQTVGDAEAYAFSPRTGGVLLALGDLVLRSDTVVVSATQASLPLPISARNKVHPSERTTPDLLAQIKISADLGRDAYERWLLWKRTLLPLALLPFAVATAGFCRRHGPGRVVGGVLLAAWSLIRVLDGSVPTLGVELCSALFLGTCAFLGALAWRAA